MFLPRGILSQEDERMAYAILGPRLHKQPDLVIAPDGEPYIYRWHLTRTPFGGQYFHIQVASDPERPLHDHPWDNMSVILAGGYDEVWCPEPWMTYSKGCIRHLRRGDVMFRRASEAHRLVLPSSIPYAMTLFSIGPKVREWGFWYDDGWRPYTEVTRLTEDGRSIHIKDSTP